ncbi:MAG: insulinase family protein, partial [Oscillospiraceae bacterium]|nr:insulinase family protein [Oscillospiraceae bacterium]
QAAALTFSGEPAAIPAHGFRPEAEQITAAQAYAVWQNILRTAFIEIAAVTPAPKPQIAALLQVRFGSLNRQPVPVQFEAPSPIQPEIRTESEIMPVGQTKLVLTYKYENIRREVMLMLCSILGWIADSLLFTNLRERCGLCYYCLLSHAAFKHTLFIDIGIDAANTDAVRKAVAAQIHALQAGDFTDDMMQKAILRYAFQAAAASDTISDLAMQQMLRLRRGDPRSPQEITDAMRKVTRADIAEAAKQLQPDTVFVLRAEQEEAEADDI